MKEKTLFELARFAATQYGDTVGFVDEDLSRTYGEFFEDTVCAANRLIRLGMQNKHVAVCGPNSYGWLVSYFAASYVGAVLPLGDETDWSEIEKICARVDGKAVITCNYSGEPQDGALLVIDWNKLLSERDATPFSEPQSESVAVLVPTSGTMGKGRVCMLTHKSLMADVRASVATVDFRGNTVAVLPLYHSFGMLGGVFVAMYNGARIAICTAMHRLYALIAQEAPRYLFIVPALADGIRAEVEKEINKAVANGIPREAAEKEAYKKVKSILGGKCEFAIVGGAPTSRETESFFAKTEISLCPGYGLTECSPAVSVNPPGKVKPGSVGPAMQGVKVTVIDPDENGCGEIAIDSDIVMAGYYNDPESNAEVYSDHGLLTGDIGWIDGDGYIFLTGRKKNLIILPNGKNVMPEELEEKLSELKTVEEVLVYDCGSVIGAKIYSLCPDECKKEIDALNLTLPTYKRISRITFSDEPLPRNALKKLIRRKDQTK